MSNAVLAFPAPVVPIIVQQPPAALAPSDREELLIVEHDGRLHNLLLLLPQLPGRVLDELEALAPRSGQEAWDLVARLWPALADAAASRPTRTGG